MDTKVLILIAGIIMGTFQGRAAEKEMFPTNYIWYYNEYEFGWIQSGNCDFKMKFVGTETVNGKEYHLFKTIEAIVKYTKPGENPPELVDLDTSLMKPYYMYAEGEKVYVNTKLGAMPKSAQIPWSDSLAIVYDFSLEKGQEFSPVTTWGEAEWSKGKISNTGEVCLAGKYVKAYQISGLNIPQSDDPYNTIQTIGNIYGCYAFYNTAVLMTDYEVIFPVVPCGGYNIYLVKVEDEDGNLIFETEYGKKHLAITQAELSCEDSSTIYNLQGVPVSNPEPGGIYIRNGKKFVMPKE